MLSCECCKIKPIENTEQNVFQCTSISYVVFFLFLFFPSFRYCIRFKDAAPNGSYCYEYLKNYHVIKGKKELRNKEKVFKGISSLLSERWMSDKYLNKKLKDSIEFYLTSKLIIIKSQINIDKLLLEV